MTEAQAKSRLLILTVVKLLAVVLIFFGFVLMAKPERFFANRDIARILATGLMLIGILDLLFAPRLLKRRWEQQDKR
jgi:protein-S-isoprenylcysteine O-methyltransferase Ste14